MILTGLYTDDNAMIDNVINFNKKDIYVYIFHICFKHVTFV